VSMVEHLETGGIEL